jgi:hypothetical protein
MRHIHATSTLRYLMGKIVMLVENKRQQRSKLVQEYEIGRKYLIVQ